MRARRAAPALVAAALALPPSAWAGEREILADLAAFFATADAGERARLARRVAADPEFRRERLGRWLHQLPLHAERRPGQTEIAVDVGLGRTRRVTLRVPRGYTPARAWPLVYALHPSGGDGPSFVAAVERLLGARVEEFVVAAPSDHRQTGLDAPAPFTADHPAILRAVREALHVDAGRQYALGYSLGGYASWAVACLHADELAGAVPLAGAYCIPVTDDGLWRALLPAFAHLPVLNVWGERDDLVVYGVDGRPVGTIGELERRLAAWVGSAAPLLENVELRGRGHGDVVPPADRLERVLAARRVDYPTVVEHEFRHLHQGRSYWLEAASWSGARWDAQLPAAPPRAGESRDQALGRALRELLGRLRGEVTGQTIVVETRHVGDLTVWVGEGMLDWSRPVTVVRDGRTVFESALAPDLLVCLNEAARRRDFDRLRWAGVRVDAGGRAGPVTADTPFPPLVP